MLLACPVVIRENITVDKPDRFDLIPGEEVTLLQNAVEDALRLACIGDIQAGHDVLHRGRRQAEAWRAQPWGEALVRAWESAITDYMGRMLL